MNIKTILKAAGSAAVASVAGPAAPVVLAAINAMLPGDKQLPADATGKQAEDAVASLPPEQQQAIHLREIDLRVAQEEGWTARYQAMCAADGQGTRARIAVMMAQVLAFEIIGFTIWAFAYPEQMSEPALWAVFGTLTGVPAGLLGKYFGELRREQRNRTEAAGAPPLQGFIERWLK